MKITYIYHSGFLVETEACYYLFDYYKGELPALSPEKPILVFASHSHQDHYNKEVFTLLAQRGMKQITAVLAKDISPKKYPDGIETIKVTFHCHYDLPWDTSLDTLQSTDAGVAFLITCAEGVIYHAGDLNDWSWAGAPDGENRQMTGSYRHEIDMLKDKKIDIAFQPLDPRQGENYARGMLYLLKKVDISQVYPMHYWGKPEIIDKFLAEYPEYEGQIMHTD